MVVLFNSDRIVMAEEVEEARSFASFRGDSTLGQAGILFPRSSMVLFFLRLVPVELRECEYGRNDVMEEVFSRDGRVFEAILRGETTEAAGIEAFSGFETSTRGIGLRGVGFELPGVVPGVASRSRVLISRARSSVAASRTFKTPSDRQQVTFRKECKSKLTVLRLVYGFRTRPA